MRQVTTTLEPPVRPVGDAAIQVVDPTISGRWDESLAVLPGVKFFHNAAWCSVLKETYGFRPRHLLAEREGVPCGVLPLMEVDNLPKGRRGISLPFTDESAVLATEARFQQQLVDAAMQEGKRRNWRYVEFRGGSPALADAEPSISFYGHHLELMPREQEMFDRCDSAVQRAIRKAVKSGVTVTAETSPEAVRSYFRLHCKTRRKHGLPPQSFRFFESIHRRIVGCGRGVVVVATMDGKPIAAAVFLHMGTKAVYKFGASDERFQHLRGNNLAMWEGIRWLSRHGCTELDFGRTSLANEGLRRFKLSWGAAESRIDYHKYDFRTERFVKERDHGSGWHTRVFRLLPGPISHGVGALFYSRLA
jgi:Acetyltransferase (GNAT) domain